jgi:hypothetical protein
MCAPIAPLSPSLSFCGITDSRTHRGVTVTRCEGLMPYLGTSGLPWPEVRTGFRMP